MSVLKRIKRQEQEERRKRSIKAKDIKEIHCEAHNHRYVRCPRNDRGHKYRGVVKCWGCSFAFWAGTQWPYGHNDRRWTPNE